MFTGIVTDIGTVRSVGQKGDLRVNIACSYDLDTVDLGASIACSGACLTVVDKGDDWFAVDVSSETISKTAAGLWSEGSQLNLERALRVGDELGGALVDLPREIADLVEIILVRVPTLAPHLDERDPLLHQPPRHQAARGELPLAVRLAPGQSARFTITVTGPSTPGALDDGELVWLGARGGITRVPVALTR